MNIISETGIEELSEVGLLKNGIPVAEFMNYVEEAVNIVNEWTERDPELINLEVESFEERCIELTTEAILKIIGADKKVTKEGFNTLLNFVYMWIYNRKNLEMMIDLNNNYHVNWLKQTHEDIHDIYDKIICYAQKREEEYIFYV
jgi:hypothetical protein